MRAVRTAVAAALVITAGAAAALSLAYGEAVEEVSASPYAAVDHRWTGGAIYDLTLKLRPDCADRPVRLLFPDVELAQDKSSNAPAPEARSVTTASIWISYDDRFSTRYPVRMVEQRDEISTASREQERRARVSQGWTDYIDLEPGRLSTVRLRFSLPPMELGKKLRPLRVPERFTLTLDHIDVGCSQPLVLRRTFPLRGREHLLKLGPRAS